MQTALDLKRVFPIGDPASAELMLVKAACLRSAGVIGDTEKAAVIIQAARFLETGSVALDRHFIRAA